MEDLKKAYTDSLYEIDKFKDEFSEEVVIKKDWIVRDFEKKVKEITKQVKKVNDVDLVKESEFMKKIVKHHAKIDQKLVVKNRYIKV